MMPTAMVASSQAGEARREGDGRPHAPRGRRSRRARRSVDDEGEREGPAQRDEDGVGDHRPRHHGVPLGEVHGPAGRPGDVVAEGDQPVHAAQGEAGDDELDVDGREALTSC